MHITRRAVAAALAAGLTITTLAACSDDGGGSGSSGPTKLNMWVFADVHAAYYKTMANQWNEKNPDKAIDLKITVYPYQDMHDKLTLAVNSGQGLPDVVDIEVNKFANFVKGSKPPLLDLTKYAAPYKDDIVQARLDLYSKDGKIYGLPTHVGANVAFYNTELLKGAGIDYTTIKTWDDFKNAGVKYHKATGKNFGVASTSVMFVETLMIAQLGGALFDDKGTVQVNSPEVVQALQMQRDMQVAGAIGTIPGGSPDSEEGYGAINRGDFAAIVYPAWYTSRFADYMPDLAGKVAIAPAPTTDNPAVRTIGGGGTGAAIPRSGKHADLAAQWLAFAKLSPEANVAVWEVLGFDPVNMSVWEDKAVTHKPDNKFNKYFTTNLFDVLNSVKDGIGHFKSFSDPNLPPVNTTFTTTTFNEIYENGTPVKEALDKAEADLKNELGQ